MKKNIVAHVYISSGNHSEKKFTDEKTAVEYARSEFKKPNCYKVKVWDLSKGEIERNNPNAEALIFELV